MKVLTKLLLVHWHYFTYELIEFGELNFLTGKNASGKSTIIDAMQLILLGDTSGSFFNKAASGKSNRNLKGYLLGELGDDEESGFRYLRNGRFSSYIAMEFYNEEKSRSFTAGCCFDIYSENDIPKLFFLYDGEMHPQGFLNGDTPMDITALRTFLKEQYSGHHETTDVGRDFRTKLYGKLGGLRDRFAVLLKKAVSFNPNVEIQTFISDFVCDDQQTVDVSHMQENIRSYKRLEHEASILQERIESLGRIVNTYENYTESRNSEMLYSFLIERALADMKNAELHSADSTALNLAEQLDELTIKITTMDKRLAEFRVQRDTLIAELKSNGEAQALEDLNRQIAEKEQRIQALRKDFDKTQSALITFITAWRNRTENMLQKINMAKTALLQAGLVSRISDIGTESNAFLQQLALLASDNAEMITQVGEAGLSDFSRAADSLKTHAIELSSRMRDEQDALSNLRIERLAEQRSLEEGVYRFPQDALDLKDAVHSRLRTIAKKDVNVRIVAEAAEITNDRWRNAIEGYLNSQKFYVIVPQEYFREALNVFNKIKRDNKLYGTGIVNIEKLRGLKFPPAAEPGSLAEEIETEDIDVRLFLDFALGRVKKCDNVQELRRHQKAITDEGVLYQNFVVRAINPKQWAIPAIGQGAIQRRLAEVKNEIAALTEQVAACSSMITGLGLIREMPIPSNAEIEQIVLAARNMIEMPALEADLDSLRQSREAIDTSAVDSLKNRIAILDRDIAQQGGLLDREKDLRSKTELRKQILQDDTIPRLMQELDRLEEAIDSNYDNEWIDVTGAPRYHRELSERGKAENIANAFPREQSRVRNAKTSAWDLLLDLRSDYNTKYKMGFDVKAADNDAYDEAWLELSDNKLPDYQARIGDAKAKAFEQFQEHFISILQSNIGSARRQINELNEALKGASFGEDTYRFRFIPKPENKRFYDMIVDEMITQRGYNLMSSHFNEKYRDEISDLFAIITNADNSEGGSSEHERRMQEYTDFRTYLSFDLEVVGHDGEAQRLSKTMGKKSGGETQTPFYIAVLASFAQLYRTGRDKAHTTSRLIIFDEAFSKMDGERIVRSIELLRKFQFQVLLSAPPDKIGDIATLVDKNLCVLREGKCACVRSFDPKRAEEYSNE